MDSWVQRVEAPTSLSQCLPAPAFVSRPLPGTGCHLGRAHGGHGVPLYLTLGHQWLCVFDKIHSRAFGVAVGSLAEKNLDFRSSSAAPKITLGSIRNPPLQMGSSVQQRVSRELLGFTGEAQREPAQTIPPPRALLSDQRPWTR